MALEITKPSGEVACDCNGGGKVCVQGTGAVRNGQVASKVYAKIVGPNDSCSASPPTGTAYVSPDASGNWSHGLMSGANCGTTPPYPANKICVWAEYPQSSSSSSSSGGTVTYDYTSNPFTGKCAASVPCS